jgi:hypothetical protein
MGTSTNNPASPNNEQPPKLRSSLRGDFQSPLGIQAEQTRLENMAGFVQPRYMTPTAASRAQVSTPDPRAATPPTTTSTSKRKAWMVSAAKRVGIIAGTARFKKEGKTYKRISPRKRRAVKAEDKFTDQVFVLFL